MHPFVPFFPAYVPRGTRLVAVRSPQKFQNRYTRPLAYYNPVDFQYCGGRLFRSRIVCLGMSALDAIYRVPAIPSTPTKVLASGFTECGGGMAANASVAVARLGGDAHYWGRVGADALGDRILAELAADGVEVGSVRRIGP